MPRTPQMPRMPQSAPAPVNEVVIPPYTVQRLIQRILAVPEVQDVLMAAVEAAGGEVAEGVTWNLGVHAVMRRDPPLAAPERSNGAAEAEIRPFLGEPAPLRD